MRHFTTPLVMVPHCGFGVEDGLLTDLYNARPTWLDNAHKALDAALFAAYGWPIDLSDEEVLERLLAPNLARAGASAWVT